MTRPTRPVRSVPLVVPAGRVTLLWLLVVILIGWTVWAFPRLTLPFSAGAQVVADLDEDVLSDLGVGLTEEQVEQIRGAIGTRPVGMVFVPEEQEEPSVSDLCKAATSRLPELTLVLVQGPSGAYGCTGDDVPLRVAADSTSFSAQVGHELRINQALRLVADPVGKAQAAALAHDASVRTGRITETERDLRPAWSEVGRTLLVVGGTLTAVMVLLTVGHRWSLVAVQRRLRRERQDRIRDRLDEALKELALVVVDRTPEDPRARTGRDPVAAEYLDLLNRARTADGGWAELLAQVRAAVDGATAGSTAVGTDDEAARTRGPRRGKGRRR